MKNFEKYIDLIINTRKKGQCAICYIRFGGCTPLKEECEERKESNKQWLLEEYVEPCPLSHDEYVILKNVDKKYKYITRDGDEYDLLGLHERKPSKCPSIWFSSENTSLDCYNHLFQFVKWEDEPYEIAKLIEYYEKEHGDE